MASIAWLASTEHRFSTSVGMESTLSRSKLAFPAASEEQRITFTKLVANVSGSVAVAGCAATAIR